MKYYCYLSFFVPFCSIKNISSVLLLLYSEITAYIKQTMWAARLLYLYLHET